jgi:hypothetical protein
MMTMVWKIPGSDGVRWYGTGTDSSVKRTLAVQQMVRGAIFSGTATATTEVCGRRTSINYVMPAPTSALVGKSGRLGIFDSLGLPVASDDFTITA